MALKSLVLAFRLESVKYCKITNGSTLILVMSSNNIQDVLQTGFRVSLGATTSLIESLQDQQKREENLSLLNLDFNQQVAELSKKGEKTEQEAQRLIEQMFSQMNQPTDSATPSTPSDSGSTPPTGTTSRNTQQELEELTVQIALIRTELEQMRNPDSNQ
jgi:prefoldin subunit 5